MTTDLARTEVPWHGVGTTVKDATTPTEALEIAGLDWDVELLPCLMDRHREMIEVPGRRVLARVTDGQVFNVVGSDYVPVQNRKGFQVFEGLPVEYVSAGPLRDGGIIWVLAKLEGIIDIKGDQVDKYVVMTNSHNGTLAWQIFNTPIRFECGNTLRMAISKALDRVYARHTAGVLNRVDEAKDMLQRTHRFYNRWEEEANHLAETAFMHDDIDKFLRTTFRQELEVPVAELYAPTVREMDKVQALMEEGKGMDKIRGTRWGAYNAVAEYADYSKEYRSKKHPDDARLFGAWFGGGNDLKQRAWDYLLKVS